MYILDKYQELSCPACSDMPGGPGFWCEVWVVLSSVAPVDVSFPCILDDSDELLVDGIYIFRGCTVWDGHVIECFKVLFCFFIEGCPMCSFVVSVCASVTYRFES